MKDYQDLELIFSDLSGDLPTLLAEACREPWSFDRKAANSSILGNQTYRFKSSGDEKSKAAWLVLVQRSSDVYYVPNLGPAKPGMFTRDEYNSVLNSFVENVVTRIPESAGVLPVRSSGTIDLSVVLGEKGMELLSSFSASANRNLPHPNDRNRLYEFISFIHREQIDLDESTFKRWLIEVGNWVDEQAGPIQSDYTVGRDLLRIYDPQK